MIKIIVKFEIMDLFVIIYTEYIMYMYYNIDTVGLPRTDILRPVSPFRICRSGSKIGNVSEVLLLTSKTKKEMFYRPKTLFLLS